VRLGLGYSFFQSVAKSFAAAISGKHRKLFLNWTSRIFGRLVNTARVAICVCCTAKGWGI
jgi:hypothetical protein